MVHPIRDFRAVCGPEFGDRPKSLPRRPQVAPDRREFTAVVHLSPGFPRRTVTGGEKVYHNPLFQEFAPILDTDGIDTCGAGAAGRVARANDADGGACRQAFLQVPRS